MKLHLQTAPPNSLLLVMDRSVGEIPETMAGALVAKTTTCLAVGTREEHDGETNVMLADEEGGGGTEILAADEILETPNACLSVCSVYDEPLLELPVTRRTRVRIWVNDAKEPDAIEIVATPAAE